MLLDWTGGAGMWVGVAGEHAGSSWDVRSPSSCLLFLILLLLYLLFWTLGVGSGVAGIASGEAGGIAGVAGVS